MFVTASEISHGGFGGKRGVLLL